MFAEVGPGTMAGYDVNFPSRRVSELSEDQVAEIKQVPNYQDVIAHRLSLNI